MTESIHDQVTLLRRKQILDAAIHVFADRGFHRTTVRDVAKAAGVADGTIYNYFDNKTALLIGILDPLDERQAPVEPAPESDDLHSLFRGLFARRLAADDENSLDALRIVLSEALVNSEIRTLFVEQVISPAVTLAEPLLHKLISDGRLKPIDVPLTLRAISSTVLGLLLIRLMEERYLLEHWSEMPGILATLVLDGILPKQGGAHDPI